MTMAVIRSASLIWWLLIKEFFRRYPVIDWIHQLTVLVYEQAAIFSLARKIWDCPMSMCVMHRRLAPEFARSRPAGHRVFRRLKMRWRHRQSRLLVFLGSCWTPSFYWLSFKSLNNVKDMSLQPMFAMASFETFVAQKSSDLRRWPSELTLFFYDLKNREFTRVLLKPTF